MKEYCSKPKLSHFEISKVHTTITMCAWTLIAILQKSTAKYISPYSFREGGLKLGNYFLRTTNKKCRSRSDFWFWPQNWIYNKFLKVLCPKSSKSRFWTFKILHFHFWGLNKNLTDWKFSFGPDEIAAVGPRFTGPRFTVSPDLAALPRFSHFHGFTLFLTLIYPDLPCYFSLPQEAR